MKKVISLLLAVVMVLSMLTVFSFAAEMPAQIHPDLASIKIHSSEDPSKAYYFEDLGQLIVEWICLNLPGEKVITLLQDTEIYDVSESNYITMPTSSAKWYNKDLIAAQKSPIVLDLNGYTLSYIGGGHMFYLERFGMNVKNGTLIYTNTAGKSRAPFIFGTSTGGTANSKADACYMPILNLDNVHVYNTTGPVATTFIYNTTINVNNSVLWTMGGSNTVNFSKSDQSKVSKKWPGEYGVQMNVKNSIIGSSKYYFISGKNGGTVNVEDSIVVSNSTSNPLAKTSVITTNFVGEQKLDSKWSMTLRNGETVSGKAFTFGKAPEFLPFTDVREADWFYSFVSEMYAKKIIAGQTATTFNPNGNLTYGAALKLLTVGVTGKDVGNATSGHWAANYLKEATAAGWTTIDADKLDAPVTREAFCEIAAKAKNLTKQPAANKFTDTKNTSVLALVEAGVINGMNETTFNPAGVLTRAQIAKIISLLIKL